MDDLPKDIYLQKHPIFLLASDHELNLGKAKGKDFYWILNKQSHQTLPSGPKKWNREFEVELRTNGVLFLRQLRVFDCGEKELKEFQFKSLHRIVITKKELCRFGIKQESDCLYCGEEDSVDHTFIPCRFTQSFEQNVFNWFNSMNESKEPQYVPQQKNRTTELHTALYVILYLFMQTPN